MARSTPALVAGGGLVILASDIRAVLTGQRARGNTPAGQVFFGVDSQSPRPLMSFDPYSDWLAIPATGQKPTHYELLGIPPFTADVEVIDAAVRRRTAEVNRYRTGKREETAQRLLEEVLEAHRVLKDATTRGEYDAALNATLTPVTASTVEDELPFSLELPLDEGDAEADDAPNPMPVILATIVADGLAPPPLPPVRLPEKQVLDALLDPAPASFPTLSLIKPIALGLVGGLALTLVTWLAIRFAPGAPWFPRLAGAEVQNVEAGQTLQFQATLVEPPPKGHVRYEALPDSPAGFTVDEKSGQCAWQVDRKSKLGLQRAGVRVSVVGKGDNYDDRWYDIRVTRYQPRIGLATIPPFSIPEGVEWTFSPRLIPDPSEPNFPCRWQADLPEGASIDTTSGVIRWTPTERQGPGEYNVRLSVAPADRSGQPAFASFDVGVTEVNQPPKCVLPETIEAAELKPLTIKAKVEDEDLPANRVTVTLAPGAPKGLTYNTFNHTIRWTPPLDSAGLSHRVTLVVRDSAEPLKVVRATCVILVKSSRPQGKPNSIGMQFVEVPVGSLLTGASASEREPFFLSVYEVTQDQYQLVMRKSPSWFRGDGGGRSSVKEDTGNYPVEQVSFADAKDFCGRLSELPAERAAKRVYRLPTEDEWEYACRGGVNSSYSFGDVLNRDDANFGNILRRTCRVGSYRANAFGLCDMHGNVAEWCQGGSTGPVARGGCFSYDATRCRCTSRQEFVTSRQSSVLVGFRVVYDQKP
ncbi:MAG: SUMF1/EgtB/PvdO family nonheme iron enzyme [Planctomycetes bacterium]|nr:SUMF1/EgtB/PvdO family nonheme iron enzyme [Planctomycetota bacterium]